MKKSIELSFIKFIKQKIKIIFIIILIPQLFSFTYFIFLKSDRCHIGYKLQTRLYTSEDHKYMEHVFNQLKSQGKINFSKLNMHILDFEGRKFVEKLDLKLKQEISKEMDVLNKMIEKKEENNLARALFFIGQTSTLYKNLGIDVSLLTLSEKLDIKYSIITLTDESKDNKKAKIIFLSTIGNLILSLLVICAIFFYNYLLRRF